MKIGIVLLFGLLAVRLPAMPAFPGAEGAGANTAGGRGGDVYHVTSLGDANTVGTLRYGINNAPASGRTICFKVSGNIVLGSTLTVNKPNLTVAGQTAPGDGICFQNYSFNIAANNVIVRHLRTRLGTNARQEADAMWINSGTNIIVDHVSASWSVDEVLSTSRYVANLTVQNCFITESLRNSIHAKGPHGYGGIISASADTVFTYHHNLYAHNSSRNPRVGSDAQSGTLRLDFRNNVVYDWGFYAGYSGDTNENVELNYVSNYLVAGPVSTQTKAFVGGATTTRIYQSGNCIDNDKDSLLDGANTGWSMFGGTFTQMAAPFAVPALPTDSAAVALQRVIAQAGATPWRRDAIDQRMAASFRKQNGRTIDFVSASSFAGDYVTNTISGTNYIGVNPWPVLAAENAPADTDLDGLPNYWELNLGMNPAVANHNHTNADGYTDLENYLNWLGDLHAVGRVNQATAVNLRALTGNSTNLNFTVASATNGSVILAGDGYTAQFLPATNSIGLAAFTFNASNFVDHVAFGPMTVTVFVTNAPPVIVTPPASRTNHAGETATFIVAAANAALKYQWRKGGANLSGATNATLTLTNVSASDAANYAVVVTNFSGATTSSVAALVVVSNAPPVLKAISDATLIAGAALAFTNSATDADLPAQALTFSLLGAPSGAMFDPSSGGFYWRPAIAQGGTTNAMSVVVSDNGFPVLSATQSFTVAVLNPVPPLLQASYAGSQFNLSVTGDPGPDYRIRASTNLTDWSTLFTTNPPLLPFNWSDSAASNFNRRFYRIELGP